MNTCQAIVNPDCSKSTIQKSPSIKRALQKVLSLCIPCIEPHKLEEYLASNDIILLNVTEIPAQIQQNIKYATVEFAGVKFKTTATSGDEYLSHVENGIVKRFLNANNFPNLQRIVICEEKYSFTPDDFKAATRQKRQTISSSTISHLKIGSEMISEHKLSKSAVIQTDLGKRLISNYLARNVKNLNITKDVVLDIDSELFLETCTKHKIDECSCPYKLHTTPV
ncbi:unnamed protein product [Mytilus coruscus]|uniref:Uncharacterized protein n=2 Tax=Mytilus TaxID=6548 RepID=A0A6J8EN71_MYTCO|nr:unnamed protein product [Mytilus coruscus]